MAKATQTKTTTTKTNKKIAIGGAAPKTKKEDYKHRTSPKAVVK